MIGVFEREDDLAGEPGIDLVNPLDIDQGGAVDAEEFCGIETALEVDDGLINAVTAAGNDGESELVLGDEMGDVVEREK